MRPCLACSSAIFMISVVMPVILMSICSEVTPSEVPATLKSMSPRWSSSPRMSVSTANSSSSLMRPMAMPATGRFIGTPASISASDAPQTVAIEDEPLDSVISDTTRRVYGNCSAGRQHRVQSRARRACRGRFRGVRANPCGRFRRRSRAGSYSAAGRFPCRCLPARRSTVRPRRCRAWRRTSACVSPRVNSAEPWARGSTPTSARIGRTVTRSRPSMRFLVFRMLPRTTVFSSSLNALAEFDSFRRIGALRGSSSAPLGLDLGDLVLARLSSRRSDRPSSILLGELLDLGFELALSSRSRPTALSRRARRARMMASITGWNPSWPKVTAPSMISSESSLASDSTISTASAVPATTSSSWLS